MGYLDYEKESSIPVFKNRLKTIACNFPVFWKESQNWYLIFAIQKIQDRPQKYLMASWIWIGYEKRIS